MKTTMLISTSFFQAQIWAKSTTIEFIRRIFVAGAISPQNWYACLQQSEYRPCRSALNFYLGSAAFYCIKWNPVMQQQLIFLRRCCQRHDVAEEVAYQRPPFHGRIWIHDCCSSIKIRNWKCNYHPTRRGDSHQNSSRLAFRACRITTPILPKHGSCR